MATSLTLLSITLLLFSLHSADAQIGVCNGMLGNNLPSGQEVVNLFESNGISLMRIYAPHLPTLEALKGTNIKLTIGVPNDQLQTLAENPSQATTWVQTYIAPFESSIRYIAVGNEVEDFFKPQLLGAMENVQKALNEADLNGQIKVSTAIFSAYLADSFPPSKAVFKDISFMGPIVNFLEKNSSPLLANIYPYFAYIEDKVTIRLDYVLFTASKTVVIDSNNGLEYRNMFDAQVDAVYAALDKAGGSGIKIVVSESGWPSNGGDSASVDNAETYVKNLMSHVKNGTPRKPDSIETYLFAMFDENQKPGETTEQFFGLFTPDQQPKYAFNLATQANNM